MQFVPDDDTKEIQVPTFDDVKGNSADGWEGHATKASLAELKSQVSASLGRLGGMVSGYQHGKVMGAGSRLSRPAMRVYYTIANSKGEMWPGEILIAGLPVDPERCANGYYELKMERSLRMAMYMLVTALQGAWNMQILSPGYSPLIPWMLTENNQTFSEMFFQRFELGELKNLLPATTEGEAGVLDGEFTEKEKGQ